MRILALEFSSPQPSVAVLSEDVATRSHACAEVLETGARADHLLAMVDAALGQAQIEREQIDCLAVGLGPGSYTGIRCAIAVAQGWQLARGTRLLGLSSADAIAAKAHSLGLIGPVVVVIDAQRQEFYLADYDVGTDGWRQTVPLRLATLLEVKRLEQGGAVLIGPDLAQFFPSARAVFPHASNLGKLALGRTDFIPGEKLEPIYLRETNFVKAPSTRKIA
jgi:tRNA threonylcarbamoyladenosine biosynthesis protein TsaB